MELRNARALIRIFFAFQKIHEPPGLGMVRIEGEAAFQVPGGGPQAALAVGGAGHVVVQVLVGAAQFQGAAVVEIGSASCRERV